MALPSWFQILRSSAPVPLGTDDRTAPDRVADQRLRRRLHHTVVPFLNKNADSDLLGHVRIIVRASLLP
jgi:hypothetical protein